MTKQKKILLALIISLVVAIAILAYVTGRKKEKAKQLLDTQTPTPIPQSPINNFPTVNNSFPIVYNKYSEAAKGLQRVLGVVDDGIVGSKTLAALKKYYPKYDTNFSINNQAALDAIIDKINSEKQTTTSSPVGNNLDRVKGIFEAVKKGKKFVFVTTKEHPKGYLDYQKVWHKTSGTVTIHTGTKIDGNRVLGYSKQFFHVATNGQGDVLLVNQDYVIAQ